MSNAIDLVVQDKAIKGLDGLIVKLQKAHEEIQKINAKGIEFNSSSSNGGLKSTITLTDEYNKLVKATEKANIQAQLAQTKVNKALLEARMRKNAINKQTNLQLKYELALEGVYSKMDAKLSRLNNEYRNLAVRKEIGAKLTKEEEKRMDFLIGKITKYDSVLKKVDAQAGKNQRNVGNYKSAFDGLGFSITQLTREAPAFANSMQTGFMAISNNIPMAVDEIQKLRKQNKLLQAEGKQTTSVLSQVGKALFSWQTLLSVGVTLLTIYGDELFTWIGSMLTGADATDKMAENTKKLNKEANEIASQTIPQFQALVKIATDVSESEERRADAIKELNKNYPDFNANILSEKDNTDAVNKAVAEYITKIGQKAKAQASMNMMQEKYNELIIAEEKTEQRKNDILTKTGLKAEYDRISALADSAEKQQQLNDLFNKANDELDRQAKLKIKAVSQDRRLNNMTSQASRLQDDYNDALTEQGEIQDEINALMEVYIDNVDFSTTSTNNDTRAKTRQVEIVKRLRNELDMLKDAYEAYRDSLPPLSDEYKRVDKIVKGFSNTITAENLLLDANYNQKVKNAEADVKRRLELERLNKVVKDSISEIANTTLGEFGMGSLMQFLDFDEDGLSTFDKLFAAADGLGEKFAVTFNAIGEVAKETFSLINSFGQQNFDAEYERLAEREAISLQFAEGNAAAEAEIRRQAEQERKRIQKREAQANKANAMFNIGINTAQGIVSALAMTPPNPVLAGIIGGIGAAQLAVVASQQIPQFKDGVRDFGGGLAIVGDGGVSEVIETKQGISLTPNKDTLVNLPKGANVYSNKEEFFNEKLNSILLSNGIAPITSVREQRAFNEEKLANLIGQEIKKIPRGNAVLNFDEKGMHTYWDNGQKRKKILNSRVRGLGRNT